MRAFTYEALPGRVIFGAGTLARLPAEAERLALKRILLLSTRRDCVQAEAMAHTLGTRAAGLFDGAAMHTPVEVTEQAMRVVRDCGADGLVALGGGSTIGLAKALALRTDLPQIAIPTTYAGSEMTPILGETADGVKTTQKSPKVLPELVIYDVALTLSFLPRLAGPSGLNAIAHGVEALYAPDGNPLIDLMALEGIRALADALPRIADEPEDVEARTGALYGAWLCGTCLGAVGMALHHKLCHVLGGSFGLPHAETHTIILPYALAYNAPAVPEVARRIATALGVEDAAQGLYELAGRIGAPRSLAAIGMPADGIERAVEIAVGSPYPNPRPLERDGIRTLLAHAYAGERP